MARLRGCVPDGPRLHPAPRGRDGGPDPGPARRGPPQPRRGDGHDRPGARESRRPADPARRPERLRPHGPDPARPAGPRPAARCVRAWSASPRPTTPRPGSSAARRPPCCRSMPSPERPCGHPGAGRRPPSATPSPRSSRRWRATAGSSSWSTAVRSRSSRPSSVGPRPATGCSARGWRDPDDDVGRDRRAAAARRDPAARPADPRQRRTSSRCRAARGTRSSSPAAACSPRPSGSTSARSRRPTPPGP